MGAFLDKPKTDKLNEHGEGNGLRFGVSSMQGWRCEMEDAHYARTCLSERELDQWSFFAVFDGHAGMKVSDHCAKHLLTCIIETEEFRSNDIIRGIHTGFLKLDARMRELPELASGDDKSGTTVVCAFISNDQLYIANCGDSRAVLCRNGVPVFSTQDHKPILPGERDRIMNAGGSVMIQRVNGSLAVSRALGDFDYKNSRELGQCEQLVSPEPEIFVMDKDPKDEFLVLACDGIWDVLSNDDVCKFVRNRLSVTDNLEDVASQVIDTCLHKGSRDNMSIVIVTFPGAPKPALEAISAEEELERTLRNTIRAVTTSGEDLGFRALVKKLGEQNIDGLPPGGGLESKYNFVASVFEEMFPDLADEMVD